jgi:hypothetical protein
MAFGMAVKANIEIYQPDALATLLMEINLATRSWVWQ